MKFLFLLVTAVAVSVDSLICGFSLQVDKKQKLTVATIISVTVLITCLFANFFGGELKNVLTKRNANLSGLILIFIGVCNLFFSKKTSAVTGSSFKQIILTGFAVGLDGAAANLSLSITGYDSLFVPFLIAFTHFLAVSAGLFLADAKFIKTIENINFVAPVILIILGVYKVIRFFI